MKEFSKSWISSKKPNKQRKFRFNAPNHLRGRFMNVHLSKELRTKYTKRAVRVRVGDKVRVLRGQYKKQEGKVEEVNLRTLVIYIAKIEHTKKDGTKARTPIQPSNCIITELNTEDKMRFIDRTAKAKQAPKEKKAPVAKPDQAKSNDTVKKVAKTAKPKTEEKVTK